MKYRILVKPHQYVEERTLSGIILPRGAKRLNYKATVVKVSKQKGMFDFCEEGDEILYDRYVGLDVEYGEGRHEVILQTDVMLIFRNGEYIIPANYIMVKPVKSDGKLTFESGVTLHIDTSFRKEKFNPTFGEVIQIPERFLYFGEELKSSSSDFEKQILNKTTLKFKDNPNIKKGDKVHFHYLSIESAMTSGNVFEVTDESGVVIDKYYLIRYDSCYCVERDGEIIFINGYCGVDIQEGELKYEYQNNKAGYLLIDTIKKVKSKTWGVGILKYMAEPIGGYILYPDALETSFIAKKDNDGKISMEAKSPIVGDLINFKKTKQYKVGNDVLLKNDSLKDLFLIQRKDINFVYNTRYEN